MAILDHTILSAGGIEYMCNPHCPAFPVKVLYEWDNGCTAGQAEVNVKEAGDAMPLAQAFARETGFTYRVLRVS